MLRAGLTGGIGSGKTRVSQIFESLGIPVFSADQAGRQILENHPLVPDKLKEITGRSFSPKEKDHRAALAALLFKDKDMLQKVNAFIHPLVFEAFENWCLEHSKAPYLMKEAAILFESGADAHLDLVITVSAPEYLRIQRVVARDEMEAEKVRDRMQHQWNDEQRNRKADFVIFNGEKDVLIPQVISIHQELLHQAEKAQTEE